MLGTIKSKDEVSCLFSKGERVSSPFLTLIVSKTQHGRTGRVAFIAGKKLGNAVWRNRAKRRMRAVFKDTQSRLSGHDVIFLAKQQTNTAPYDKLRDACDKLFKKAAHQ